MLRQTNKPCHCSNKPMGFSFIRVQAGKKCAATLCERYRGWNHPRRCSHQIPCWLFWFCECLCARRPLGSKWKHPSSAAPPTSASHSIDVEKACSLITFHTAKQMVFGSAVVIRAELNCMKLFNGPLMIDPFAWLMWCEAKSSLCEFYALRWNRLKFKCHIPCVS